MLPAHSVSTTSDANTYGIREHRDINGSVTSTIQVVGPGPDKSIWTARFDPTQQIWQVVEICRNEDRNTLKDDQSILENGVSSMSAPPPRTDEERDDWTSSLPKSPHTDFFRQTDWTRTPLGSLSTWPRSLRLHVYMLFSDSRAAIIYWGPHQIAIYNEAVLPLIGGMHPRFMGESMNVLMPDLWEALGPTFREFELAHGQAAQRGLEVALYRHGFLEETHWDGSLSSLRDDDGGYGGTYTSWLEETKTVLRNRWASMRSRLKVGSSTNSDCMWQHIFDSLAASPRDVPMAAFYAAEDAQDHGKQLLRKHLIAVAPDHPALPPNIDLAKGSADSALIPFFRSARQTLSPIVIDSVEAGMDSIFRDGIEWAGHGDPCRKYIMMALRAGSMIRGYILLGLNPRRDFDAEYQQDIDDLGRQLQEVVLRVTTEEERQAHARFLTDQLTENELHMKRIMGSMPIGMYELDHNGTVIWCNSRFYDLLKVPEDDRDVTLFNWMDYIVPEDLDESVGKLDKWTKRRNEEMSDVIRVYGTWIPPHTSNEPQPAPQPAWVKYHTFTDKTAVRSAIGYVFDVSHEKWAELLQRENIAKAEQERLRLEEFIDVVSHEMRNPLSAVIQCADSIIESSKGAQLGTSVDILRNIAANNLEAAEAVLFCANHQKRIIDDVLTLGKLNSEGSNLCLNDFEPSAIIAQALHMFKSEIESAQIQLDQVVDGSPLLTPSLQLYGDSNRLMQVIINLLTNAIKFTRTQQSRQIWLRSGTSLSQPDAALFGGGFHWSSTEQQRPDIAEDLDARQGDNIYWYFALRDSGQGIPQDLTRAIFSKFNQGDRRTHIKYGGSGLGLYISRELCEMHGGHIGNESEEGVGSTFAFYVKVKAVAATVPMTVPTQIDADKVALERLSLSTNETQASDLPRTEPAPRLVILLVEDNLLNQKILRMQLEKSGCRVITANHGGEAIDIVAQMRGQPLQYASNLASYGSFDHFDCILMDWEMPVCNGLKATQKIREMEARLGSSPLKILGITANARQEQISKAINSGMDAVIPKPFRVSDLLLKMKQMSPPNNQQKI